MDRLNFFKNDRSSLFEGLKREIRIKKRSFFLKTKRSLKKLNEKRSFLETINPTYIVRKRIFLSLYY